MAQRTNPSDPGHSARERIRPLRSETRAKVLEAAFAVFSRNGIAGSSLTQVAAAAGLTKGAVYSNFDSKDDLVLALMEQHAAHRIDAALAELHEGASTERALAEMAAALVSEMRTDAAWHRLLAEYFALTAHDPLRRRALQQRRREVRYAVERVLRTVATGLNLDMPLPPSDMATVLLALSNGLAVETDIDPDGVPADLFGRVLTLIVGDAVDTVRAAAERSAGA